MYWPSILGDALSSARLRPAPWFPCVPPAAACCWPPTAPAPPCRRGSPTWPGAGWRSPGPGCPATVHGPREVANHHTIKIYKATFQKTVLEKWPNPYQKSEEWLFLWFFGCYYKASFRWDIPQTYVGYQTVTILGSTIHHEERRLLQ